MGVCDHQPIPQDWLSHHPPGRGAGHPGRLYEMYIFNALSVILIVIGLPPAITKHSIGHGIVALLGFSWWVFLLGLVVHGWVTDRFDFGRYLKKAEQGDDFARLYVAGVHESRKKQYREAVRWYRASADQGSPAGQYHLGRMYQLGLCRNDILRAIARSFPSRSGQGGPAGGRSPQDVYQEISIRLIEDGYRRIKQYAGRGSFSGFVRTVARNLCSDLWRTGAPLRREVDPPDEIQVPDPGPSPLDAAIAAEEQAGRERAHAALRAAMAEMPGDEALCLTYRFVDGMKAAEIAKVMRRPVEEIYRLLPRAKSRLAAGLKARGGPQVLETVLEFPPEDRLPRKGKAR